MKLSQGRDLGLASTNLRRELIRVIDSNEVPEQPISRRKLHNDAQNTRNRRPDAAVLIKHSDRLVRATQTSVSVDKHHETFTQTLWDYSYSLMFSF